MTFATFEFLMRAFYQEQGLPPATNEQMKEAWIEYLVEKKRKQSYQQAANNVSSRN